VPEIRDFTNKYRVGELGKVILQVSIAVFWALSKNFSGKDRSATLQKIGPYAYAKSLPLAYSVLQHISRVISNNHLNF